MWTLKRFLDMGELAKTVFDGLKTMMPNGALLGH